MRRGGQETAARIVEAAYQLLRTGSLSDYSMRAIAKRAGVRLASVQYHFPTMEHVVRAIVTLNARKYADGYERAVGDERRVDASLRRLLETALAGAA